MSEFSLCWLWATNSQHPLLPAVSSNSVQRGFFIFLFVCLCVWLGQIFCSSFPACPLSPLHSPAAVWWNRLILNQPAGGNVQACVINYSVTFMLGAHGATALSCFTVFLHIELGLDGFISTFIYATICAASSRLVAQWGGSYGDQNKR